MSVSEGKGKALILLFYFFLISGCSLFHNKPPLARISPPPEIINSASGFFSFRLERDGAIVRGRAVILLAPGKGRIEVLDPIGRLTFIAFWLDKDEWLVVPAKKTYWSGSQGRGELMARLIDLPLEPVEILAWIIGRGQGLEPIADGLNLSWAMKITEKKSLNDQDKKEPRYDWQVEWNEAGRLSRGQKNGLKIQIQEYLEEKGVARILTFSYPKISGKLIVFGLDFNRPLSAANFQTNFIIDGGYRAVTWDEMKSLLKLD